MKAAVFNALRGLVSNRCYPDRFPQASSPLWPAIRVTMAGGTTWQDLDGDGGADNDDLRVQVDWVAETADARTSLGTSIRTALEAINLVMDGPPQELYDAETKTFRGTADWIDYQSP